MRCHYPLFLKIHIHIYIQNANIVSTSIWGNYDLHNYQNQNKETKKAIESGEDIFQLLFLLLEIELRKQVN